MLYEPENSTGPVSISDNTVDCSFPRIDSQTVIWVQSGADRATALFLYDLTKRKPKPKPAPEGFVWEDSPQTDGNLTVLSRYDGNDREIFVHDNDQQILEQISKNNFEDRYPRISGNHIAWVRGEGQASEIYLAFYDTEKRFALASPGDGEKLPKKPPATFSWTSAGYDEFKIQFSENLDFNEGETLTFPSQERKWLAETSFTPKKPEWSSIKAMEQENGCVFWRVKVKDADPSEAWSFSIE
jgi:hypothetical protein